MRAQKPTSAAETIIQLRLGEVEAPLAALLLRGLCDAMVELKQKYYSC